jgi:hypothetical protein
MIATKSFVISNMIAGRKCPLFNLPRCHMRKDQVFTFASNEAGIHGKGAAKTAMAKYGAQYGKSYGHYGQSFAIPTKDEFITGGLTLGQLECYIAGFKAYAYSKRKLQFIVTRIGCGLAGFTDDQIAPLFKGSPKNCIFDARWYPYLGDDYSYFEGEL